MPRRSDFSSLTENKCIYNSCIYKYYPTNETKKR